MVRAVFVYGTLMPGHLRWPLVEPHATGHRPASTPGRLFDTGLGWPAAVLGAEERERVPGFVVEIEPGAIGALLVVLDEVEDVHHGLYERIIVALDDGTDAWAWSCAQDTAGLAAITAWTHQPER